MLLTHKHLSFCPPPLEEMWWGVGAHRWVTRDILWLFLNANSLLSAARLRCLTSTNVSQEQACLGKPLEAHMPEKVEKRTEGRDGGEPFSAQRNCTWWLAHCSPLSMGVLQAEISQSSPSPKRSASSWIPRCVSLCLAVSHVQLFTKLNHAFLHLINEQVFGTWYLIPFIISQHKSFPGGSGASLVAQLVKNSPAMQETWVRSLGWEDPLEKRKAIYASILAWRIPWSV